MSDQEGDEGNSGPQLPDWLLLAFCCLVGPLTLLLALLAPGTESVCDEATEGLKKDATLGRKLLLPWRRYRSRIRRRLRWLPDHAAERLRPAPKRVLYLDFWRTLCVALVVVTHACEAADHIRQDEEYAEWNVFGVQQWVLPILTLIAGALFAKSRQSLLLYQGRLLTYFSLGVLCNATCAELAGERWYGELFPDRVVFQVAFVILFVIGALIAAPLRSQLRDGQEATPLAWLNAVAYLAIVLLMLALQHLLWCLDLRCMDDFLRVSAQVFVTAFLAAFLPWVLPSNHRCFTGWALLVWIYSTKILHREHRPWADAHHVDLFIWAFFVQRVPLPRQSQLGRAIAQGWPVWVIACGLILRPGVQGRFDQQPFETAALRVRQYLPEAVVVLAFVAVPTAGSEATLPLHPGLHWHIEWLNCWSLIAYVTHKAIFYLVQPCPHGLVVVLVVMPVLGYVRNVIRRRAVQASAESAKAAKHAL